MKWKESDILPSFLILFLFGWGVYGWWQYGDMYQDMKEARFVINYIGYKKPSAQSTIVEAFEEYRKEQTKLMSAP